MIQIYIGTRAKSDRAIYGHDAYILVAKSRQSILCCTNQFELRTVKSPARIQVNIVCPILHNRINIIRHFQSWQLFISRFKQEQQQSILSVLSSCSTSIDAKRHTLIILGNTVLQTVATRRTTSRKGMSFIRFFLNNWCRWSWNTRNT